MRTGKNLRTIKMPNESGWSIAFLPDGKTVMNANLGEKTIVASADIDFNENPFQDGQKEIAAVTYSTDGKFMALGTDLGEVKLWSVSP